MNDSLTCDGNFAYEIAWKTFRLTIDYSLPLFSNEQSCARVLRFLQGRVAGDGLLLLKLKSCTIRSESSNKRRGWFSCRCIELFLLLSHSIDTFRCALLSPYRQSENRGKISAFSRSLRIYICPPSKFVLISRLVFPLPMNHAGASRGILHRNFFQDLVIILFWCFNVNESFFVLNIYGFLFRFIWISISLGYKRAFFWKRNRTTSIWCE